MIKIFSSLLAVSFFSAQLLAQIPKPADVYGFDVGTDYKLADYNQMLTYYEQLANSSNRIRMIDIGKSVMGKPIKLFIISSAENMARLQEYKAMNAEIARASIKEKRAIEIIKKGKAIIWIDGGMHAIEAAHGQMTSELAYKIVSEESAEMKKIRKNVIVLLCPMINPDGLNIVAEWYRQNLGTPYEVSSPPILYQKYVGHDNNRDWFMNNMPETRAATTVLYKEWYPQIVHNHHQTSPSWARIFLPPFRSPVNPRIHPGVTTGVNLIGTAMANRFAMKRMPGVISQTSYSMWWNGGMRTAPYYHNQIGILTEVAHRTPTPRFYPSDSVPKTVGKTNSNGTEIFYPYPWQGGESHFRDAVDYMIEASMGILAYSADRREDLLLNFYTMGRDAIEGNGLENLYAYIIEPDQWDAGEARNLVNILIQGGIEVDRATKSFKVDQQQYPKGTYILFAAQSFRPFLEDLMEKQEYPDQFQYPGGPPQPPYDLAGWTLPMQMGVKVKRIEKEFKVKTEHVELAAVENGSVVGESTFGYLLSNQSNLSVTAINKLQKSGAEVWLTDATIQFDKTIYGPGSYVVKATDTINVLVQSLSNEMGLQWQGLQEDPGVTLKKLDKIKVGIYKSWMANMDEGWTRWVLDQHEFVVDTLHNKDIINKSLSDYSAIIIPSQKSNLILNGYTSGTMPDKYVGGIGLAGSIKLKNYVEQGGVIIALDAATDFVINQFGLPVQNITRNLSSKQFFIPGSLVRAVVDQGNMLGYGSQAELATSFSRSRAFKVIVKSRKGEGGNEDTKLAPRPPVEVVVRYAEKDILMSGWARGEDKFLKNKAAMMSVGLGEGKVVLFGFKPQFRGQPRASYRLLFNSIYLGAVE
jgi:glutamine amidotransferase-like uncharacterized protein